MAAPTLPYAKDVNGQAILATPVLPLDAAGNPLPAGGGGPVTVADGADATQGAKADVAWSGTGAGSVVAILKALWAALTGTLNVTGAVTISPVQTDATSRSGTIAAGGAAQVLMAANPSRKGWIIQNQSVGDLYVRSRGSAGTTDATIDQNSMKVGPGAAYVSDWVTANAISIIGATTAQAFFAREW